MYKLTCLTLALIFSQPLYAAENYDISVTLQSRDNYAIQGKSITLKTYNCQEISNSTPATLSINGINNSTLSFENGTSCRVTNISNPNNESFD